MISKWIFETIWKIHEWYFLSSRTRLNEFLECLGSNDVDIKKTCTRKALCSWLLAGKGVLNISKRIFKFALSSQSRAFLESCIPFYVHDHFSNSTKLSKNRNKNFKTPDRTISDKNFHILLALKTLFQRSRKPANKKKSDLE